MIKSANALIKRLPKVRGEYSFDVPLSPIAWFRVGGAAEAAAEGHGGWCSQGLVGDLRAGDAAEAVGEAIEGATETVATAKVGCLMIVIMQAMGALSGYVIYLVWPDKIFESIPVTGISLLITPLIIGGLMSLWGICKLSLNYASSFPATFLGGAVFGLAAAGTRLALLA